MNNDPIKISRDDLASEGVESRLREQSTVRSTKEHYERAQVVAPQIAAVAGWRAWLLKSIVYLALFGLFGGAVGSIVGASLVDRPDRAEESAQLMADLRQIDRSESMGRYSADDARQARTRVREIGQRNAQFVAADVAANGDAAKSIAVDPRRAAALSEADRRASERADLLLFAITGFLIAGALAAADRFIERDTRGTVINGGIAGLIGAAAGGALTLLMPIVGVSFASDTASSFTKLLLVSLTSLSIFGGCVGAVPGLVILDRRRALAGICGGIVGGLVGGLLLTVSIHFLVNLSLGGLLGFASVGAAIGVAMGWFEEAGKQGWLRVASGLIAGKQFILYRNPTFVGSAPMSHIYLFRDPQVGRRHAAIFQVTSGYEIENLPLGGPTLVNGLPVTRVRLRRGDKIGIGRTTLVFDEKVAS